MSSYVLFENERGSASVRPTGQPVSILSFYSCRLRYFYHCIHCTTLGPQLLAAGLDDQMIQLLRRTAAFYSNFGFVLVLALIATVVFACLGIYGTIPFKIAVAACSAITAMFFVLLIIDVTLCIRIDARLQYVWDYVLAFPTDARLDSTNEFIEFSWDTHSQYIATDLSSHLFAAELRTQGKIQVMVYNDSWYQKHHNISSRALMLVLPVLLPSLCLANMFFPGSTVYDPIYTFVLGFFVAVILQYAAYFVYFALNVACLCIPSIILSRAGEGIEAQLKDNFSADRKAPYLPAQ